MHTLKKAFSAMRSARVALLFTAVIVAVPALITTVDARREESWEALEREVKDSRYPAHFLDSLHRANGVMDNRGLSPDRKLPFQKREKLVFDGGLGAMRAGYVVVDAQKNNKTNTMDIVGKAATNGFVGAIFRIRDFVLSRMDADGVYPLFFEQHVEEGKHRDKRWTLFDHKRGKVFTDKDKDKPSKASPLTHNYLSLIYYLRTLDFAPGDTFSINCFVHKKDYPIHFTVMGREKIKVDAGSFDCLKLKPRLVGEGRGFTKNDQMYIWVTDDHRRMPVMLKSEMSLGALSAKLVYYESE